MHIPTRSDFAALAAQLWVQQILVFTLCFWVLLATAARSLYTLDSAEFAVGAATLGIIHAPGYPLYLLIAHGFTWLPVGDISYRVTLVSVVSLALAAAVLYRLLSLLVCDRWAAFSTTLIFSWSYYVWGSGVVAEIYAPQLLTLALVGTILVMMRERPTDDGSFTLLAGLMFGVSVAMHPVSALFAPGMIFTFRMRHIPWKASVRAAVLGLIFFGITLLYLPIRYAAHPALNLAGAFNAQGVFQPIDLRTLRGVWWVISGQQFETHFFAASLHQIENVLALFWANYLGLGLIIGVIGAVVMFQTERKLFWVWLSFVMPYTVFYGLYNVPDVETMFGPTYLLWTIAMAYGLTWIIRQLPSTWSRPWMLLVLPLTLLVVNYPLLDLSNDRTVRDQAEGVMNALPDNAVVFGRWWDIVPLQYLNTVEHRRSDVTLCNLFLMDAKTFDAYFVYHLKTSDRPLVLLGIASPEVPDTARFSTSLLYINIPDPDVSGTKAVVAGFIFVPDGSVNLSH